MEQSTAGALHKEKNLPLNSTTTREPIRAKVCTELSLYISLSLLFLFGCLSLYCSLFSSSPLSLSTKTVAGWSFYFHCSSSLVICNFCSSSVTHPCLLLSVSPLYLFVDLLLLLTHILALCLVLCCFVSFFITNHCFHESLVAAVIPCSLHLILCCYIIQQPSYPIAFKFKNRNLEMQH